MNRLPFIIIFTLLFLAGFAAFFEAEDVVEERVSERLVIATTIFPVYDMVRSIAGDEAETFVLLSPGASPHTFEPTPTQAEQIHTADILFEVGIIDEWTQSLVASNKDIEVVSFIDAVTLLSFRDLEEEHADDDMSSDIESDDHAHSDIDPHYWLSIKNAKAMARQIHETLVARDPSKTVAYTNNHLRYQLELDKLAIDMDSTLADVSGKKILSFHDSWQYLERDYGFETVAVVQDTPGVDALANNTRRIYSLVEEFELDVIFSEPQLARTQTTALTEDLNLVEYTLDPIGGVDGRDSYIELMRYNANILNQALIK